MDDYQEMERFGMDYDFEGAQWIGREFYYRRRKDKPIQTKDDAIYRVFGDDDDDEEEYGGIRRKHCRKDRDGDHSYLTKPVNFISTGTVMPTQEIDNHSKQPNHRHHHDPPPPAACVGLGFSSSTFTMDHQLNDDDDENNNNNNNNTNNKDDEDDNFLPTAFGKKILEGARGEKRRDRGLSR
ncbi:Tuftelin interacting protein, N-terminal domain containing protein, partial [Trema orientale]